MNIQSTPPVKNSSNNNKNNGVGTCRFIVEKCIIRKKVEKDIIIKAPIAASFLI